jgi:predicted phosphoribosyltransferase
VPGHDELARGAIASGGVWYRDFSQTTDEEVRELLRAHDVLAPTPTHR